jgi:hypothetical protein
MLSNFPSGRLASMWKENALLKCSGIDWVLEETMTCHMAPSLGTCRPHSIGLQDISSSYGWRSELPCMQWPMLTAMSNQFLFFVHVFCSLEKRACFLQPQPTRRLGRSWFIWLKISAWSECADLGS